MLWEWCFNGAGVKGHSAVYEQFQMFAFGEIPVIQRGGITATHLVMSDKNNSGFVKLSLVV